MKTEPPVGFSAKRRTTSRSRTSSPKREGGRTPVTVGFVALLVLVYRVLVKIFPIISVEQRRISLVTKYSIRGTAK